MAYLRVIFDDTEIERRELSDSLVIGRSPECDVGVRDILLSRRHCRIEPDHSGRYTTDPHHAAAPGHECWRAVDLSSKNGTTLNNLPLASAHPLADGDVLQLGRVRVIFGAGKLTDAGLGKMRVPPLRPVDPIEALSGTVCGYQYLEAGESARMPNRASPRPQPPVPAAYAREDVYSLLSSLASSSWDSIYEQAKRPVLPSDTFNEEESPCRGQRPRSPMDLSLQVDHCVEVAALEVKPAAELKRVVELKPAAAWMAAMGLKSTAAGVKAKAGPAAQPGLAARLITAAGLRSSSPAAKTRAARPVKGRMPFSSWSLDKGTWKIALLSAATVVFIFKWWMISSASQAAEQAAINGRTPAMWEGQQEIAVARLNAATESNSMPKAKTAFPAPHLPASIAADEAVEKNDPDWKAAVGITTAAIPWLY